MPSNLSRPLLDKSKLNRPEIDQCLQSAFAVAEDDLPCAGYRGQIAQDNLRFYNTRLLIAYMPAYTSLEQQRRAAQSIKGLIRLIRNKHIKEQATHAFEQCNIDEANWS